jgi:hypothetical protein
MATEGQRMTDKFKQLETALNTLVTDPHPCWAVLVRGGLDNGVTLSLGDKRKRPVPLDAPSLTPDQQQFAGAYELAIADCTWRLDAPDVIGTSWSDTDDAQRAALKHLLGQPVNAWEITWPGLDLTLHFANRLALRLFCDQTDPVDGGENYTLHTPKTVFHVGVRSQLTTSPRPKG